MKKFYHKTWFMVVTFFIFPPAFLFSLFTHPNIKKGVKIGIVAAMAIVGVIGAFGGASNNDEKTPKVPKEIQQIATEFNVTTDQANNINDVLQKSDIKNISEFKYEEFYNDDPEKGVKGYRLTSDGIKNIIVKIKDGQVYSIRWANNNLYANGKQEAKLSDWTMTINEQSILQIKSQDAITSILKSPKTAEFPNITKWAFNKNKDRIIVQSYVDSQNGFGAMIRSNFQITFSPSGETIIEIIFDGKKIL